MLENFATHAPKLFHADECYRLAEERAAHYFKALYEQVAEKTYVHTLTKDIQSWKSDHIHHFPLFSYLLGGNGKPDPKDYHRYIQWLDHNGKLHNYLDRSISYIFMRDLGKALDSPETKDQVQRVVDSLKTQLTKNTRGKATDKIDSISIARMYREAQKEGIESTMIWVINKLKTVSENLPQEMEAEHAKRKLIKLIGGVLMHELQEMDDNISPMERKLKLEQAVRLGYSYGLTYPFIDDLLDANVLSHEEKIMYSNLIRTTLVTGVVPELGEWDEKNRELIKYVHSELREAFEYIKAHQKEENLNAFFEQSYVFFNSQEVDRVKELTNSNYTNEEIYIPIILKSSSSRLIVRSVISAPGDKGFDDRTFFYGIYNQLADDFADMFDDMKEGAVTPYTYYMTYHGSRPDLINPFDLYWSVISNLIHNVYHSDPKTCEVILDRAINGLKRFKQRLGTEKYKEVMGLLTSGNHSFYNMIHKMVEKADDVDFFDKLLRDKMITMLKDEKAEQQEFIDTMKSVRSQINGILNIPKVQDEPLLNQRVVEAANYSLEADGKRLRPLVAWVMGVNEYGLDKLAMEPLLRSLEYMHTASLIFDDLPSQDNSPMRRGQPTLHQVHNIAIAELAGLFLTQKAVEQQALLEQFDSKTVLKLISYSAHVTAEMCMGQAMDLDSKGKKMTLEQLNTMCFYKTGIAFEASLIMPAILAKVKDSEIETLKKFAQHAGIAFQIKDDLLDIEGNPDLLGKPAGLDNENNNTTFVTILGEDGARKQMWEHYCLGIEVLAELPHNTNFLKHLLDYIVNRDH